MSMHAQPLTPLEEEGLVAHGLKIGKPSQMSDCFRLGIAWAMKHVSVESFKLGSYGKWYDGPLVCRAYTRLDPPDNGPAWRIGKALDAANQMSRGDEIDGGLNLLKTLADEGYGVFELPKKE